MSTDHARAELAATTWHKAGASQGQNACVELARVRGWTGLRDSKLGGTSPILALDIPEWGRLSTHLRQR